MSWSPARQALLCILLSAFALAGPNEVHAQGANLDRVAQFNIEAQSLASALIEFSRQTGLQVITQAPVVEKLTTQGVHGRMSVSAALIALLQGTGIGFHSAGANTIGLDAISSAPSPRAPSDRSDTTQAPVTSPSAATQPLLAASGAGAVSGGGNTTSSEGHVTLDEIVVTATKQPSTIHEVPISIAVVSGQTLSRLSINNLEEMSAYVPNLTIADTSITTNVYMRGIGSGQDRGFEQSVGLFVDGIYMGRSKQYRTPMFDVDRVEVLRGPQPVLFGKNTTAGAIKIESRKPHPGDGLQADLAAQYETEFNGKQISAVLSGSPTSTTGLRLAALYSDTDGFAKNTFRAVREPGIKQWVVRLTGVWQPRDDISITAKYEHADFKYNGQLGEPTKIGFLPSGSPLLDLVANRVLYSPIGAFALDPTLEGQANFQTHSDDVLSPQGSDQTADNAAVTLEMPLTSGLKFTSVLGYSKYKYGLTNDVDFLPVPFTEQFVHEKFDQKSLEARVASDWLGPFDFLAGAYWQMNSLSLLGSTAVNWQYLGPLAGTTTFSSILSGVDYNLDTHSQSVFAQTTWRFAPAARLNLGGRYGGETKKNERTGLCTRLDGAPFDPTSPSDVAGRNSGFCPRLPAFAGRRTENHFMPSVQLQWDLGKRLMAYAKWDKSYKSGGFNAGIFATSADIVYQEEKVSGYEIGLKSVLADGAAVVNLAAFDTKFTDLQVNTLTGNGQTLISNAGAATSRGVELDGTWAITRRAKIGGATSYLNSKYDDYARGPCNAVQRSAAVGSGQPCVQNLTGRPTTYAPRWSGDLFGEIEVPVSANMAVRFHADANYSGSYFYTTDLDPNLHQSGYWKFGARLTLADTDGHWDVSLLGKNLSNEKVVVWGVGVPLVLGTYVGFTELPRTVTLQANYRFLSR